MKSSLAIVMQRRRSIQEAVALTLLGVCLGVLSRAWGQEVTATITGSVVDPTGASIANANFTAKDTERGTVYTVQTNSVGVFNLPRVPVGTYDVKVGAPGFQTAVYLVDTGAQPDRTRRFSIETRTSNRDRRSHLRGAVAAHRHYTAEHRHRFAH